MGLVAGWSCEVGGYRWDGASSSFERETYLSVDR